MDNPWLTFVEIVIAAAILGYLFFRRQPGQVEDSNSVRRIEIKLLGAALTPSEISVPWNRPAQLVIHRLDSDPEEELFEVDELRVYALLPALHTTIIPFNPQQRGSFPMILGGERKAGVMIVE
jgi:plastocyanin domain-containing protein